LQFAKYEHFSAATKPDDTQRTTSLIPLGPKGNFPLVPKSRSLSDPLSDNLARSILWQAADSVIASCLKKATPCYTDGEIDATRLVLNGAGQNPGTGRTTAPTLIALKDQLCQGINGHVAE
jgi:hypothetical protein